jgi:hypothetical protein
MNANLMLLFPYLNSAALSKVYINNVAHVKKPAVSKLYAWVTVFLLHNLLFI